jgi:cobalt/nickel transport system permease protein
MLLLHITIKKLDPRAALPSPLDSISPPARILAVLVMLMAISLTPNAHWLTWMFYACGVVAILQISRVDLLRLIQRLAVESVFVGVVVLGTLFRAGGEVLWQWGALEVTTVGVMVLGSVSCKLILSLTLLNLLTLTIPIPELLKALASLKVPPLLVAILSSMYRYLDLLIEEFATMKRAAIARNLTAGKDWQRLVIGNMIGALFIRTYDRGNRIHAAMVSRGYGGDTQTVKPQSFTASDRVFLIVTGLFAILGQILYLGK